MKRQSDREGTNHDRPWKNHRRPIRLVLEPLETRRLLAGINVSVLIDQDGSRSADAADTAASRRVVFLDLNNNGQQDSSEPVAFTNEHGIASFEGIAAGDYAVGIAAGNSLQSQTFPTRVEELATHVGPAAKTLIAAEDLTQVWAFDADGQGQNISSASTAQVRLGGAIVASASVGADAWIIVRSSNGPSGTKLVQFNLQSGRQTISEIRGLNGRFVDRLVKAGSEVVLQLSGPGGIELAKVSLVGGVPTIGTSKSFPNLVTFAGGSNQLAVLEYQSSSSPAEPTTQMQPLARKLSVIELSDFSVKSSTNLTQSATEIALSADGSLVLAALSSGGVLVLNNDVDLNAVAKLAEATGPLLTQSKDGRIVTGNVSNRFEFIVWNVESWQPSGRTRVSTSTQVSMLTSSVISNVVLSNSGDRLMATGMMGTVASQLAQATTAPVTVADDSNATVELGVRVTGVNKAPSTARVAANGIEDSHSSGNLRTQVNDAENDTLWFNVLTSPSHGSLRVSPTGEWIYQPSENFNGTDRAILRVFDGQDFNDLALVLNVTPVNDPPQSLLADIVSIPEAGDATLAADGFGYVTVFDVDQGSNYQFNTPDQRFQIRNGRIYLAPNAKLDFETEPTIQLEIIATEDAVSGYQISTTATLSIADVNEPPTAVRILSDSIPENFEGATVGQLQVDDPDSVNRFDYVLSDARFMVEDGYLKLKPGVELDFEQANSINLSITVSDSSGQSITQPVTLNVADQNDPPTSIDIQSRPIEEATPGAVIGLISVNDQDGQAYQYTVSDARFEVVDGTLKLKDGQTVNRSVDKNLELTVTATSVTGSETIAGQFDVAVVAKKPIHQNPVDPRDVNGDGKITPLDALLLINYINSFGSGPIRGIPPKGGSGEREAWIDVNGDGIISPLDALIIVNWLNRQRLAQGGDMNASGEDSFSPAPVPPAVVPAELACPAIESRTNSQKDHELENLLDQLTRERLARS